MSKIYSIKEVLTEDVSIDEKVIYRKTLVIPNEMLSSNTYFFDGYFGAIGVIYDAKIFTDWTTDNGMRFFGDAKDLKYCVSTTYLSAENNDGTAFDLSLLDSITLTLEYTKQ